MGSNSSQVIVEGTDLQAVRVATATDATADNNVTMLDSSSFTNERKLITQHVDHVSDTICTYRQSPRIEPEIYQVMSLKH